LSLNIGSDALGLLLLGENISRAASSGHFQINREKDFGTDWDKLNFKDFPGLQARKEEQ
jgi:hypothetical protein